MSVAELRERVIRAAELNAQIEGVTFLGGEPFDQAAELGQVAKLLKADGLSIMVFTGFTIQEIMQSNDNSKQLFLEQIDLLVDGRFDQKLVDRSRPWVGSTNQEFHFLSDRYSVEDLKVKDSLELTFSRDGKLTINGWATTPDIEGLLDYLID